MIVLSNVEGQPMVHRIFIAINLPEETKKELLSFQGKWSASAQATADKPELPARWAKPENLHITLVFYGNASDAELQEIKKATKEIGSKHRPFTLKLSRIMYGPSKSQARMIWGAGDTTKELSALQNDLATALHRIEKREFSLHLTLARFREWEFSRIDPEDRPEINEEISFEIPVNSVEVMESKLKRGGAEYTICESISLA